MCGQYFCFKSSKSFVLFNRLQDGLVPLADSRVMRLAWRDWSCESPPRWPELASMWKSWRSIGSLLPSSLTSFQLAWWANFKLFWGNRHWLPTNLETIFKISFLVLYSNKNKFLKTKLVNPFQFIKMSPKEKRGAASVYIMRIKTPFLMRLCLSGVRPPFERQA